MHTITDKKLLMLKPFEIRSSPYTSRNTFDDVSLNALAQNISVSGMIEPLPVRRNDRGFYELICGERRLKAAKIAGVRRVPCVVHNVDSATAAIYSLSENIHSDTLNFFDEAEAIERIIRVFGLTHTEAAIRLGIKQSYLNAKLKLLKLSTDLREQIEESTLPEGIAMLLLKIPPEKRRGALEEIILKEMDTRAAAELIDGILSPRPREEKCEPPSPKNETPPPLRKAAVGDIRIFSNSIIKLYESMHSAGFDAHCSRRETDQFLEYKIRIFKREETKPERQLTMNLK